MTAKVICLTGGMASGKSTAVNYLEGKGAAAINADKLGHLAYEPGTATHAAVVQAFGENILGEDDRIDRKLLGSRVFGKPDELKKLTDIVWPEIHRLSKAEIARIQAANPEQFILLEAAVLLEAGWDSDDRQVWVISVDPETAIARTMTRDGVDREAVLRRLEAQLSNEEREARADIVIDNNGTEGELVRQLDAAWNSLHHAHQQSPP